MPLIFKEKYEENIHTFQSKEQIENFSFKSRIEEIEIDGRQTQEAKCC
jgi:hypothetical protein